MIRLASLIALLVAPAASAVAEDGCRGPSPIFHCEDWRLDSAGHLTSTRPVAAGLIELGADSYLGDRTIIDGIDYAEALQKQCGR